MITKHYFARLRCCSRRSFFDSLLWFSKNVAKKIWHFLLLSLHLPLRERSLLQKWQPSQQVSALKCNTQGSKFPAKLGYARNKIKRSGYLLLSLLSLGWKSTPCFSYLPRNTGTFHCARHSVCYHAIHLLTYRLQFSLYLVEVRRWISTSTWDFFP